MNATAIQPHPEFANEQVLVIVSPANVLRMDEIRFQLERLFPALDLAAPATLEQLARTVQGSQHSTRLLIAVGGDGTLHHVLQHCDPQRQVLGLLPAGTGNDFARGLGFADGMDLAQAAAKLAGFRACASDLCSVNGIRYINSAGFGLDTETVKVREASRGLLHRNYTLAFLVALRRMQPLKLRFDCLAVEGGAAPQRQSGSGSYYWVLAMNSRDIGRGTRMAPLAQIDDGRLDLILLRAVSKLRMLQLLPKAIKGQHIGEPGVDYSQVTELDCHLELPLETLAVDGEVYPCGSTEVSFRISPGKLTLLR